MSIEMEESHREREAHFRANEASEQAQRYHRERLAAEEERWLFSLTEQERKRWREKKEAEEAAALNQLRYLFLKKAQEKARNEKYQQLNSERINNIRCNDYGRSERKHAFDEWGNWIIAFPFLGAVIGFFSGYFLEGIGIGFGIGIFSGPINYILICISNPIKNIPDEVHVNEEVKNSSVAAQELEERAEKNHNVTYTAPNESGEAETTMDATTFAEKFPVVGRNEPCPCGSGKKFKFCHGQLS